MNIEEKYDKLIKFFYEISKVPRNSTFENRIAEYLCDFARNRNLEYRKDELCNVIIRKEASNGYENKKPIIFQAHTDMVCEKTIESNHNFAEDPIEIINDGTTLKAKDTTLGADDGIGMSYLLLFLDDNEIKHPEIYCLFTTQEEIGMDGAKEFNYSGITANYLINIDGEEENTAIVGCAGGARVKYFKKSQQENVDNNIFEINIVGLRGGHSGVDINKGRQNSNYLCANMLKEIDDIRIVSFIGGNKDNAIPNSTRCIFSTSYDEKDIKEKINSVIITTHFVEEDAQIRTYINRVENCLSAFSNKESKIFLDLILNLKQGVIEYSKDKEGLVEASGNIGIVEAKDGTLLLEELIRSSDDEKRIEIEKYNNEYAYNNGYSYSIDSSYPGWKYKPNSNLERVYKEAYLLTHNNEEPKIEAIHAGVECGMIYKKMSNLELISIGPDIVDVHTVNETLNLKSCKSVLNTIIKMLELLD